MNKKLLIIPAAMLALSVGFAGKAAAEDNNIGVKTNLGVNMDGHGPSLSGEFEVHGGKDDKNGNPMMASGIFGTVTAVNGNTITVQTKTWTKGSTTSTATSYTVNASGATVDKNRAASTVANIAVGDNVMVEGTISGTTVTATKIHDGVMVKGTPGSNNDPMLQGNGQPVVGGKVTAVSGNTVTITNSSNAVYTIDVTNAKITKAGTTATASNIAIGDEVLAQGTINGSNVAAVTLVDGVSANNSNGDQGKHLGWFKQIGGFFKHLFGF